MELVAHIFFLCFVLRNSGFSSVSYDFFGSDVGANKDTVCCKLKIQHILPKKESCWSRSRHFMLMASPQPVTRGPFSRSLVCNMATCGTPQQNSVYSKMCFIRHLLGKGICRISQFSGYHNVNFWGRDSAVGIATRYWLDGPGSNPCGGKIFCTRPYRLSGPPSLLYN